MCACRQAVPQGIDVSGDSLCTAVAFERAGWRVRRLTQESIAAVSLANQVSFVLSLFIGAIVGAIGVLVAQYYGKGDFDTVRNLLSMALRYVLVLTVIFFLLAFFLPEHLMTVFTDEQDLIAIGASYLRIVSFSYLFQGASQCYLMLMKVDGQRLDLRCYRRGGHDRRLFSNLRRGQTPGAGRKRFRLFYDCS